MSQEKRGEDPQDQEQDQEQARQEAQPACEELGPEEAAPGRADDAQAQPQEAPSEEAPQKTKEEELAEQVGQLSDKLLRTMAEYDNFRKRSQREKEAIHPQATANAVAQFVPILDTIERALSAPCTDESFKKGVEMILQNFKDVLVKQGVEEFGAVGEPFDPETHNAVMHVEDDQFAENSIVEVFQKGYRIGERIVRHAMVKVAN